MTTTDELSPDPAQPEDSGAHIVELIDAGDEVEALRFARTLHPADLAAAVSTPDTAVRELVLAALSAGRGAKLDGATIHCIGAGAPLIVSRCACQATLTPRPAGWRRARRGATWCSIRSRQHQDLLETPRPGFPF